LTFLYADPHAHLWALPVTVLALLLGLSILKGRWRWGGEDNRHSWLYFVSMMVLGGITIGALRPTNTWDLPTYLVLGGVALLYAALRNGSGKWWLRAAIGAGAAGALVLLSFLLYQPYADWYQQGYNAFDLETQRATFWSYLTHWGLFLFVIAAWLFWEVREWMASTPLSSLNKLKPYRHAIYAALALFLAVFVGLLLIKISIAWVALPLAAVAAVLILRPGQPDSKRAVLFMIGSGLFLTLFVDAVVLEGAGRMNTVFKFYMQAWTLLSLSAAAALIWLLPAVEREWLPGWRNIWQAFLIFLIAGSAMYPILAGSAKIQDRMSKRAPHAVDGMAYMQYAEYADFDAVMDLSQDYNAIRWLQENVQGSPVIVEGHVSEYRWGSRYTIYTGLPGVVGWNWHQRQQRGVAGVDQWVTQRVDEIGSFYNTDSAEQAVDFLERYDVRYIIVGQMERAMYDPIGIAKFMQYEGELWHEAYSDGQTVIYEVNGQPR
jgi:YYY domain-containing protein